MFEALHYLLVCFFITSRPFTRDLSILETSPMKTHKKRPFENHAHYQYNVEIFLQASTVQGLILFVIDQVGVENSFIQLTQ